MTVRLAVVTAGVSEPSSSRLLADRLVAATTSALRGSGADVAVDVVELRQHARGLADNVVTGFANADLRRALELVVEADGLVAVTPVFSASYSGLFKTFFDVLDQDALSGKPVLLGATAGTARHSLVLEHAMRPLFSYLRAVAVPTAVFAGPEDWGGAGEAGVGLAARVERAGRELAALLAGRPPARRVDPYADVTPFERLLAGDAGDREGLAPSGRPAMPERSAAGAASHCQLPRGPAARPTSAVSRAAVGARRSIPRPHGSTPPRCRRGWSRCA